MASDRSEPRPRTDEGLETPVPARKDRETRRTKATKSAEDHEAMRQRARDRSGD